MPEEYKKYLFIDSEGFVHLNMQEWSVIEDGDFQQEVMDYAFANGNCIMDFN